MFSSKQYKRVVAWWSVFSLELKLGGRKVRKLWILKVWRVEQPLRNVDKIRRKQKIGMKKTRQRINSGSPTASVPEKDNRRLKGGNDQWSNSREVPHKEIQRFPDWKDPLEYPIQNHQHADMKTTSFQRKKMGHREKESRIRMASDFSTAKPEATQLAMPLNFW